MIAAEVRRARAADVPALGRLGAEMVSSHHAFDPARFIAPRPGTEQGYGTFLAGRIDDEDTVLLVAESGGEVIGYVFGGLEDYDYMALRGPAGVIYDLVVDPARRGHGVGAALLDAALAELRARGAPRVLLSTAEQNAVAQRLFARAGFRRTMIEMTKEL